MKALKLLAVAFIAAAAFISTASAQTKIYITGSTAFRSATVNAITSTLSGTVTTASDNASLTSANAVTWTGGNIGGTAVTIKASWSGAVGGGQTVAGSLSVRFLPDGATGTANADPRTVGNPAEVAIPDIAMTDNLQSSTPFTGGSLVNGGPATYATLTDNAVGVVSFTWAASVGFPTGKSMTKQLAQYQLGGTGSVPLAFYTGLTADQATLAGATGVVYATGRDPDSGTRVQTLAESGYGVFNNVNQWKPTVSGSTITALALYPIQTINGVSTGVVGNSGESSGSTLRTYLTKTLTSSAYQNGETGPSYMITYLGVSDFNQVSGSGAVALNWNGVPFSQTAIMNGQYTFWGYEHIMWRPTLGNGTTGGPVVKLTFGNNLKNTILASTSATLSPNVALSDMAVTRTGDGGPILNPNF